MGKGAASRPSPRSFVGCRARERRRAARRPHQQNLTSWSGIDAATSSSVMSPLCPRTPRTSRRRPDRFRPRVPVTRPRPTTEGIGHRLGVGSPRPRGRGPGGGPLPGIGWRAGAAGAGSRVVPAAYGRRDPRVRRGPRLVPQGGTARNRWYGGSQTDAEAEAWGNAGPRRSEACHRHERHVRGGKDHAGHEGR